MTSSRRYSFLCPIARALDRVGDRWALLILRDLHAGPARFKDLQQGLSGIAANLLTDRLKQLQADGLVEKQEGPHGTALYALTEKGKETRDLLFELARFGGHFDPEEDPKQPGNLRTLAVTLSAACSRVAPDSLRLTAQLTIDGQAFILNADQGAVSVVVGTAPNPDLTFEAPYESLLDVSEGRLELIEFARDHVKISAQSSEATDAFLTLMAGAIAEIGQTSVSASSQ